MAVVSPTVAIPSYRFRIPNGERVPAPPGVEGGVSTIDEAWSPNGPMPDTVCKGVGHATCEGGTFPLNPFGIAFLQANFKWTKELCEADSDGDGQTNGAELGDPCCEWEFESLPLPNFSTHDVSHPGFASSVSTTASSSPPSEECKVAKAVESSVSSPPDYYNEGEERHHYDMFLEGYTVPKKRTTYIDFALEFNPPECQKNKCQIVAIEGLIDTSLVHHYILDGCRNKWPAELVGKSHGTYGQGRPKTEAECVDFFGAWAPGRSPMLRAPGDAGIPFGPLGRAQGNHNDGRLPGGGMSMFGFNLQMHYDNPYGVEGMLDKSGLRVYYTTSPREFDMQLFTPLSLSSDRGRQLPAQRERHYITQICEIRGLTEPVKIIDVSFHAHLLGREMYLELYRNGKMQPVFSESTWHFDDQYVYNIEAREQKLYNGDVLSTTCVYDSRERTETTVIGTETTDEMCWSILYTMPYADSIFCRSIEMVDGELEQGESAHTIVEKAGYAATSLGKGSEAPLEETGELPAWKPWGSDTQTDTVAVEASKKDKLSKKEKKLRLKKKKKAKKAKKAKKVKKDKKAKKKTKGIKMNFV